jgi:hypothetical protein
MQKGEQFELLQNRAFKTARELLEEASIVGEVMPLIFSNAANCKRLIFWGELIDIEVYDKPTQSRLVFGPLSRITGRLTQDLILRSEKRSIAENFIRPYAVCITPDWLRALAERRGARLSPLVDL